MKKLPKEIIHRIEELHKLKFNQREVAYELGISKMTVGRLTKHLNWPKGGMAQDQKGANNPNFVDGLSRATLGRTTKRVLIAASRNLFVCERCGKKNDIELPRHHKDRDKSNNTADNLEVLCVACHNREHLSEKPRHPKTGQWL